jgi:hypothetical protein
VSDDEVDGQTTRYATINAEMRRRKDDEDEEEDPEK